jgi:hypothetical protein
VWRWSTEDLEDAPSLSYRRRSDQLAIDVEKVEEKKDEASALPESEAAWINLNVAFPSDPNAAEFPIEIRLICWQNRDCRGYGRILTRPVEAGAGQQRDPAAVRAGVHAISVVLDLMQPLRALRRRVYQFAKLDPRWKSWRGASRLISQSILSSQQRGERWYLYRWAGQGGSTCHGRVGEVTYASRWCPARSTRRPRRRARNPFAYTRFGEGRREGGGELEDQVGGQDVSERPASGLTPVYVEDRAEPTRPATRITLRPHDPSTGEEVEKEEVVRGYEYERGRYITFSPDELNDL